MFHGKAMIIRLIAGMIKETFYKMSQYFPKPYIPKPFWGDVNVKVDLSNYATKTDLKKSTGIDTSNLTLKSNLVKVEIDKIDVDKLKTAPVDWSKLSNIVNSKSC